MYFNQNLAINQKNKSPEGIENIKEELGKMF